MPNAYQRWKVLVSCPGLNAPCLEIICRDSTLAEQIHKSACFELHQRRNLDRRTAHVHLLTEQFRGEEVETVLRDPGANWFVLHGPGKGANGTDVASFQAWCHGLVW